MRHGPISIPTFFTRNVPDAGMLVLAANTRRFYALLTNISASPMYLMFGSQNAFGDGIFLAANGFGYEIDQNNMWRGDVYAIHGVPAATRQLSVFEGV